MKSIQLRKGKIMNENEKIRQAVEKLRNFKALAIKQAKTAHDRAIMAEM